MLTSALAIIASLVLAPFDAAAGTKEGCSEPRPDYGFKFSGFFKADWAYETARSSHGNFVIWVPAYDEADDAMYLTARETRLGLDFWWKGERIATDAKLEFDFFGLGAQPAGLNAMENKAAPMLRHAYIKLSKGCWSVLAGQTSDIISPLVPKTVNYTVGWGQGNLGYRRPQVRVSMWREVGEKAKIGFDVAAARNLGSDRDSWTTIYDPDSSVTTTGDGFDDGAAAALPVVEGRLGFTSAFSEEGSVAMGVSGHWGRETYTATTDDLVEQTTIVDEHEAVSWSFNVDLTLRITSKVSLSGEFFTGQNLSTYFGGILQDGGCDHEVGAMGGWGMLSVAPVAGLTLNGGYAFDDPEAEDLAGSGTFKDLNSVVFGNLMYGITENVTGMIELSYNKTEFIDEAFPEDDDDYSKAYDDFRVQFALKAAIK